MADTSLTRRAFLGTAAVAAGTLAAPSIIRAQGSLKPIKLGWYVNAACLSPVAAAKHLGIFERNGLDVELVKFGGSTDQLLEALATRKVDTSVGMALRWLKPLEQGFDVKLTGGTHGGCLRLLGDKTQGITKIEHLKGKVIAVSDIGSPAKNFFSIFLGKRGLDPAKDVEWKVFPGDLLAAAVEKGEAQALAHQDPETWRFLKVERLTEIATNLTSEYGDRVCCLVGVGSKLLKEDRAAATAITKSLLQAQDLTAHHPEETADVYLPYVANTNKKDLIDLLKTHTHYVHPLGNDLRKQLADYVLELQKIGVIKQSTDPVKFAEKITVDVV
ncbi:MAG TPA: ABC transporter substrate-binding protein [Magnetospirillum sp.]|nr:ABC transporter substrate-binding protein [Magnetospirillum sp.]